MQLVDLYTPPSLALKIILLSDGKNHNLDNDVDDGDEDAGSNLDDDHDVDVDVRNDLDDTTTDGSTEDDSS